MDSIFDYVFIIFIFGMIGIVFGGYFLFIKRKGFLPKIPFNENAMGGYLVPLVEYHRSVKWFPLYKINRNSFTSEILFLNDGFILQGFYSFTKRYNEISEINIFRLYSPGIVSLHILIFSFKGHFLIFNIRVLNEETLENLVLF